MSVKFLSTGEEFKKLIPLVEEFSTRTESPLWQNLHEVTLAMHGATFVIFYEREELPIAYICGAPLQGENFMISQSLSKDPGVTMLLYKSLENKLQDLGYKRILLHCKCNPRIFKKYGFNFSRFLLSKELGG